MARPFCNTSPSRALQLDQIAEIHVAAGRVGDDDAVLRTEGETLRPQLVCLHRDPHIGLARIPQLQVRMDMRKLGFATIEAAQRGGAKG